MTITYSINSGSEIHGVFSSWSRVVKSDQLDGTVEYAPYAVNTWTIPTMPAVTFEVLRVVQGQALVSLETNGISDRNTGTTYTGVILQSVSAKAHEGTNLVGVEAIFLVDVS